MALGLQSGGGGGDFDRTPIIKYDARAGRIFRIDAKGEWTLVVQYDGEPNGMKFRNDHELVITDYKNGLMVLDVRSGSDQSPQNGSSAFTRSTGISGMNDLSQRPISSMPCSSDRV